MESDRNRQLFIEKMLKKSQASLKETASTAVTTMYDTDPSLFHPYRTQIDDPHRGPTRR
jgi:hypothetical protein